MNNQISGQSTRTNQTNKLRQLVDSRSSTETLTIVRLHGGSGNDTPEARYLSHRLGEASAEMLGPEGGPNIKKEAWREQFPGREDITPRRKRPSEELPDKMGLSAGKPHPLDANFRSSNSSSPRTSSPARPRTSLFEYRTAELREANVSGICIGLIAEWLLNVNNSASARMNALIPGSQGHASAAVRQQQYQDLKDLLLSRGVETNEADLEAQNTMLQEAGLAPSGKETKFKFGESSGFSRMLATISQNRSNHLLSLHFAEGGAHTVATSTSNETTTLFDPNYGEFTARSNQMASLFQSLATSYRNPNGRYLSIVTAQRMC
ncbi:YopT-type cysteine protease domain-containing protein [Mesorhizobium amorphae]|uniref:YopT-type cysteine protease domain-containing protein n=1 Tax=Mesorhizobium amorphae TaxID=71433 RepID=UPI0024E0489C|nr:YopT-type cysteine protease domain-containing protein [Mesorhizobium amorphae]